MRHDHTSAPSGRGKRRTAAHAAARAGRALSPRRGVNDRGTVLLMVLGVLALMAIIVIIYAGLGKADRASSASLVRNARVDDQVDQVAAYLSGVIGRDVTATSIEYDSRPGNDNWSRKLEMFDYGFTDPAALSQSIRANWRDDEHLRFDPAGSYDERWPNATQRDIRQASDPYLAASEPVCLRYGFGAPLMAPTDPNRPYLDHSDWASISNFAPSGNFVNFANLRNNFGAESGFGNVAGRARMSEGLSVFNENGVLNPVTGPARLVPANFSNNQYFAFRPMYDDLPPDDPDHVNNQWCDTDGDGFADARWFELVDVFNQNDSRPVVPNSGRARLFIAARCEDLSGRINVNTASDLLVPPGLESPNPAGGLRKVQFLAGQGPQDVDLARVLSLSDHMTGAGVPELYDSLPQPAAANAQGDYSAFDRADALAGGRAALRALWHTRDLARTVPLLGNAAMGDGELVNRIPPQGFAYDDFGAAPAADNLPPSAMERFRFFSRYSSSGDGSRSVNAGVREFAGLFDESDLLELLTFNGVNDSTRLSRLEATLAGRALGAGRIDYDPLRSNRPRTLEMKGRGTEVPDDEALLAAHIDVRRLLTTISGERPLGDRPVADFDRPTPSLADTLRIDATRLLADLADPTSTIAKRERATAALFRGYADALMPFTDQRLFREAWNPDWTTQPGSRTLSYGGQAELAYLAAAHMALNLTDSFDRSNTLPGPKSQEPTAASLDLTREAAADTAYDAKYPWPRLNLNDPDRRDDDQTADFRLPRDNAWVKSAEVAAGNKARLTMFGMRPQPFITQVTAMSFFHDVSPIAGDEEATTDLVTNLPIGKVKINVDQNLTNNDFLFSVLAFQITNPFDVDIEVETADRSDESFYYFEYAGRTWRLRPQDPNTPMDLSGHKDALADNERLLRAGETKVYYATFPASKTEIEARFDTVKRSFAARFGAASPYTPTSNFKLEDFARTQFVARGETGRDPVHIAATFPETGEAVTDGSVLTNVDLHATLDDYGVPSGAGTAAMPANMVRTSPERRVVNLWRVMRDPGASGDPAGSFNKTDNDILVDRLRDPGTRVSGTLAQALVEPGIGVTDYNKEINGTTAGDDGSRGDPLDDTGFSYGAYASISRPTNPLNPALAARRGAMPPWCFEAKADNEYRHPQPAGPAASMNKADEFEEFQDRDDFRTRGFLTLDELVFGLADPNNASPTLIDEDLAKKAESKTNNPYDTIDTARGAGGTRDRFRTYLESAPVMHRVSGSANRSLYSRVGDLLLPMIVGPSFDPEGIATTINAPGIPSGTVADREARWMTMSEALALAANYYSPSEPLHPYYHFGSDTRPPITALAPVPTLPAPPTDFPKADRGCLALDAWSPFLKRGNTAPGSLPTFEQGVDEPLGSGVPMAFNVLDRFRVSGFPGWIADAQMRTALGRFEAYGSLTRAVPGRININTAPMATLRALPLLSPDFAGITAPGGTGWLNDTGSPTRLGVDAGGMPASLWNPAATTPPQPHDGAAAVAAYRDKIALFTRRIGTAGPIEVNFRDARRAGIRTDPLSGLPVSGREDATGIDGLRPSPGFKSVGEVMAVQIRQSTDPAVIAAAVANPNKPDRSNSITRFALDGLSNYSEALDATTVLDPAGNYLPDTAVDDYGERLTLANALLNTISVRSDVFCVWFVIYGFTPEDTAVEDGYPMVPSVARRYVMVVDRSNVTGPTVKPKIVMLRELPLQ